MAHNQRLQLPQAASVNVAGFSRRQLRRYLLARLRGLPWVGFRCSEVLSAMRPGHVIGIAAYIWWGASTAQGVGELQVNATCVNEGTIGVVLTVRDVGGTPELIGFDIYRSLKVPYGTCSMETRITEAPLPRLFGQDFAHDLQYEGVLQNTLYKYRVVGVDANRDSVDLYRVYDAVNTFDVDYASCGIAQIAQGILYDEEGSLYLRDCVGCFVGKAWIGQHPPDMRTYLGYNVILLGDVTCSRAGCLLDVESVVSMVCPVAVQERTWTYLKVLYR